MSLLKVTLPGLTIPTHGLQVSFEAPCSCKGITGIVIDDVVYTLVDSMGNAIDSYNNAWCSGAIVSVTLDTVLNRAFVLNTSFKDFVVAKSSPFNHLINSYFSDAVGTSNSLDHWTMYHASGTQMLSYTNKVLTFRGILYQLLELDLSKVYTFAVRTLDGDTLCVSGIPANGSPGNEGAEQPLIYATLGNLRISIGTSLSTSKLRVNIDTIDIGIAASIEWAALYEGEYNIDNLPEYRQKGYAVELAACHVADGFGFSGQLKRVWSNENATSTFKNQTIKLSTTFETDDEVHVHFRLSTSASSRFVAICKRGATYRGIVASSGSYGFRAVMVSDNSIEFDDAYYNGEVNNSYAIPIYVYVAKKRYS